MRGNESRRGRMTMDGRWLEAPDTTGMMFPVQCTHCGKVYDVASVEVTARYADCSVWKSPCCKRTVDDRKWKGLPDIKRLGW